MKQLRLEIEKDNPIIFRTLSAEEADRFYQLVLSENVFAEEFIFNTITDNKYDINELSAGLVISAIYSALSLSGFFKSYDNIVDKIEEARKTHNNSLYTKLFYERIIRAMPGTYKLEELKLKSLNELLELVALAEGVAGTELFNIKEMRTALSEEKTPNKKKSRNKAINSITKDELDALKASLQANEHEGSPIEYI